MKDKHLSVLIVEDSESDAELVVREFHNADYNTIDSERVETADEMWSALARQSWDLIIADYNLPEFNALSALEVFHELGIDVPFIVVSGAIGEETAVAIMKAGAHDYIFKNNLSRLGPSVSRELRNAEIRRTRRAVEKALQESEERFRELFENMSNAVVFYQAVDDGDDFLITGINTAAEEIERVTREGVLGKSVQHVFPGIRDFGILAAFRRVYRTGIPERFPAAFYKDLRIYGWRENYLCRLASGEVAAIYDDVTERKLAEERLIESQSRYKALVENSGTGIVIVDENGIFQFVNKNAADTLGRAAEEIVGKSMFDLLPHQTAQKRFEDNRLLIKSGGSREYEDTFVLPDGQRTFLIVDQCIHNSDGRNYAIQSSLIDVTERRRVEEVLKKNQRLLAETQKIGKVGGWEFDIDTGKQNWTEEIYRIHELDPAYEPTLEKGISFYTPASRGIIEEALLRAVQHGEQFDLELEIISAKGNFRNVHVIGKADLEHRRVSGFFHDITQRKFVEEELRFSHRQLRALAARLQQVREEEGIEIARAVHDELGGGLTGLKMSLLWLLQLIEEGKTGDEQRASLIGQIHEATVSVDSLMQTVRRIATELRPPVLDDLGLIPALEWQLQEFTKRTKIVFEFATAYEELRLENGAATGVFRIFQAALTNVAQHSEATKVTVSLGEDDESLFLEITDNGRGIDKREMIGGEALGILGMKERALLFGGNVTITGRPSKGTTVLVRIPLLHREAP